jgi:PAS domain S-box-containing protein
LELQRAECEFLTGLFAAAEERLLMLSRRAEDLVDSAVVARLRTELYTALDQTDRAVAVSLEYLRSVGVHLPLRPTNDDVRQECERIWQQLGTRPIEALVDLPPMTDPTWRATLDVLTAVEEPAYFTHENLQYLVNARIVNLSLEHGNSDGSCLAYVQMGWLVGPRFSDHQAAFRFGKLGLELVEKRGLERFRTRVTQCFGYFINPWSRHVRTSLELLRRSFTTAQEAGDLKFAVYACDRLVTLLLAAGDPLGDVQREAENGLQFARSGKFGFVVDIITGQLRFIRTLRGLTPSLASFSDAEFDEERFEQHLKANPEPIFAACWYWIRKLQAFFYAGDYASALEAASKAKTLLQTGPGHFEWAEYDFYVALAQAALYDSALSEERARYRTVLSDSHKQFVAWARNCPENFGSCAALVAAEIARIEGRDLDAMHLYERAIQSARVNGFVQNEAIAYEVAARFYAGRSLETIARAYLRNARYSYMRWGALGKVKHLELRYPNLREPADGAVIPSLEGVDALALAKASQAISGELDLGKLIETLLVIALKNAGAQRGVLVLLRGDEPRIEAEAITAHDAVTVRFRQAFPTPAELPDSILRYVIRTHEYIILDDASAPTQFSADDYVQKQKARSVLCLPLIKQGSLKGALYLENNLASHVFTPDRISVLKLLASQAAISLENTCLYRDLKEREAKIRRLVDANIIGIFIWNLEGEILEANEAFLHMLEYSREDLVSGRVRWTDLTPAEWRDRDEQGVAEVKATGTVQPFQKEFFRKDGSRVPVLIGGAMFEASGNEGVAFVLDLSEQKRADEERERAERTLLEERTRLAGEIHDALTQSFVGIAMELQVATELLATKEADPLEHIQLAYDTAKFGLAEAQRSVLTLQPTFIETLGLIDALQMLVKRSNIPGRLRCDFQPDTIPERNLSPGERHELLRIAQEAICNAVRHAKPTLITVTLRWKRPNLVLDISDNGSGMAKAGLHKSQGFGLGNMRARASKIGGQLEIQSAPGRGTRVVVSVPIRS